MILSFERVPKILCSFSTTSDKLLDTMALASFWWYIVYDTFMATLFAIKAQEKNLTSNNYWSSTSNASNTNNAWNINFNNGNTNNNNKNNSKFVRCVRAG